MLSVLANQTSILNDTTQLIDRSFLADDQKENYKSLIAERNAKLSRIVRSGKWLARPVAVIKVRPFVTNCM